MERLAGGLTKTQAGVGHFLMSNFKVPQEDGIMGEVRGRSASVRTEVKEVGSSSLLVMMFDRRFWYTRVYRRDAWNLGDAGDGHEHGAGQVMGEIELI